MPLPYPVGYKQVTDPTYTQREGIIQKHESVWVTLVYVSHNGCVNTVHSQGPGSSGSNVIISTPSKTMDGC